MGKILMIILIFAFIYLFIVPSFRKSAKKHENKEVQNFVECDKCKTYIDIKDSVLSSGKHVCKECIRK